MNFYPGTPVPSTKDSMGSWGLACVDFEQLDQPPGIWGQTSARNLLLCSYESLLLMRPYFR